MNKKLEKKMESLQRVPGVYLFINPKKETIYVGKGVDLKSRVKSYFTGGIRHGPKTKKLVENIADLECIETSSEFDALVLEAELIKKHKPKYNIVLKDDRSYLYVAIDNSLEFPAVNLVRGSKAKEYKYVYGPFQSTGVARSVQKLVRKIVPFRDCGEAKFRRYKKSKSQCLYGRIDLCPTPCVDSISKNDYRKEINKIKKILSGKSERLLKSVEKKMYEYSKSLEYENATKYRNILERLEYAIREFRSPKQYIDNPALVDDLVAESLEELVKIIPKLKRVPNRIECYDISNISGKEATGSMVVAINGRLEKKDYRKFKIRADGDPDDVGMMREVFLRRFKRKGWVLPDFIIVDGGKGQVSAAKSVLDSYGLEIEVVGLAKQDETIIVGNREISVDKTNEGLKLMQRLRDEAHRFAKRYHVQLRIKKILN